MSKNMINPDKCIACTTCVVACPVAKATPNFLGPRLIGPAYERFRLLGLGEDESLHYCANCKNCEIACPHGVPITTFIMLARAKIGEKRVLPVRDWVLGHGETLAKLLKYFPAFLKNFGMLNPITRVILDAVGVAKKAPLPAFGKISFKKHFKTLTFEKRDKDVVFFPGCYIDTYDYKTGEDIAYMLNRAGYNVIVPDEFSCCGLPMVSNGFMGDVRKNAEKNLPIIAHYNKLGVPIVTGCPSCALMFKADIPEYFPDLVDSSYDGGMRGCEEFLTEEYQQGNLDLTVKNHNLKKIIYHAPCHLKAQGGLLYGYELMSQLEGVEVINANAGCCGISGSYGFKKEKYKIGLQIGADLFKAINESGADIASSECGTCQVQMRHGADRKVAHPLAIIRSAIDGK